MSRATANKYLSAKYIQKHFNEGLDASERLTKKEYAKIRKDLEARMVAKAKETGLSVGDIHRERIMVDRRFRELNSERRMQGGMAETRKERIWRVKRDILNNMVDDETYRQWHESDHVSCRWLKGGPGVEGSELYIELYIDGKLHKKKFKVAEIIPNKKIVYTPLSFLQKAFCPKGEFFIEFDGDFCLLIASKTYRLGGIIETFFREKIRKGLSGIQKHMQEEGENMKRILEDSI